ncbi:MAG: type II secretion system GspH family protein [Candidatus Methanomethyliaceae archaeon]|nr:type II secretion system GspH family protein [Candidatus Methanomethyliaceae archaeon]
MRKASKLRKGFTLIELLIVIAVIAILAAVVAPNAFSAIEKSKMNKIIAECKVIEGATLQHYTDTSEWPRFRSISNTNMEGYLRNYGVGLKGWNGPYLERWPQNPFNSGAVESQQNYQLDYRRVGSSDCLVIEISLNTVPNWQAKAQYIDQTVDNGDGQASGKIQWSNEYVNWIMVKGAKNVKNEAGNSVAAH